MSLIVNGISLPLEAEDGEIVAAAQKSARRPSALVIVIFLTPYVDVVDVVEMRSKSFPYVAVSRQLVLVAKRRMVERTEPVAHVGRGETRLDRRSTIAADEYLCDAILLNHTYLVHTAKRIHRFRRKFRFARRTLH